MVFANRTLCLKVMPCPWELKHILVKRQMKESLYSTMDEHDRRKERKMSEIEIEIFALNFLNFGKESSFYNRILKGNQGFIQDFFWGRGGEIAYTTFDLS